MEQRAFVAVVLRAAVLILYQAFLVPSPEPGPTVDTEPQAAREPAPRVAPPAPAQASAVAPLPPPTAAAQRVDWTRVWMGKKEYHDCIVEEGAPHE
jgi:hypothetical protein